MPVTCSDSIPSVPGATWNRGSRWATRRSTAAEASAAAGPAPVAEALAGGSRERLGLSTRIDQNERKTISAALGRVTADAECEGDIDLLRRDFLADVEGRPHLLTGRVGHLQITIRVDDPKQMALDWQTTIDGGVRIID